MSLTNEQKHQLNRLIDYRDQITNSLFHIERIIKTYFPEEFEIAYQQWIPQITTALYDHDKWLPRGEQTLQNTIDRLQNR
jgi:flagellar biosynthesis chaperone FliJ